MNGAGYTGSVKTWANDMNFGTCGLAVQHISTVIYIVANTPPPPSLPPLLAVRL